MQINKIAKIAILGAECSGKTTVAKKLALNTNGIALFEYLRYYTDNYSLPTTLEEQYKILYKQISLENWAFSLCSNSYHNQINKKINQDKFIYCDTCPLLIYIYSLYYLSKAKDNYLLNSIKNIALEHHASYKQTILLPPLPWVYDNQRDSQKAQIEIYNLLLIFLTQHNIEFSYYGNKV